MRQPLVIANWKMHTKLPEAEILLTHYKNIVADYTHVDIVICPPAVWLVPLTENLGRRKTHISLGAQNTYFELEGNYTGEISPRMLKGIAKYVIVGHSERRKHFAEDIDSIIQKIRVLLDNNFIPVVCLGEQSQLPLKHRQWGKPIAIDKRNNIYKDLNFILKNLKKSEYEKIIIAYEPVWAIGTGKAASGAYAQAVISGIRERISELAGETVANKIRILYGGSVNGKNIAEYMHQPGIDGVLVGTASLKIREFKKICEVASERRKL